jgi:FAD binding domain
MLPLMQPDTERIIPVEHKPTHDRAPEELALGSPLWLRDDLVELIGEEQVYSRLIDLVKYATDASPYRMFPKVVVSPRTVEEVNKIFAYAQEKGLPVTIRSAGSSLRAMGFSLTRGSTGRVHPSRMAKAPSCQTGDRDVPSKPGSPSLWISART